MTEQQREVLQLLANVKGDGWFYSRARDGAIVGGLKRRGLLISRRDHNGALRTQITEAGRKALASEI